MFVPSCTRMQELRNSNAIRRQVFGSLSGAEFQRKSFVVCGQTLQTSVCELHLPQPERGSYLRRSTSVAFTLPLGQSGRRLSHATDTWSMLISYAASSTAEADLQTTDKCGGRPSL